jgi:hypothetical protein
MPEISISEDTYERLAAFKGVVEAVIEEEIDFDTCADLILGQGIDAMLADLLGPLDPGTLLKSVQQLGAEHPAQVYSHFAETMRRGADVQQARESVRRQLGFQTHLEGARGQGEETG